MTVVVFKSKSEVFSFMESAKNAGIGGKVVAVPKEIKIGCGLAVGLSDNYSVAAGSLIRSGDYRTFYGIFKIKRNGFKSSVAKIF